MDSTTKIEVKLLSSGRYAWSIECTFPTEQGTERIKTMKDFDNLLKMEFPDYTRRGSGRVASMDEE